MATLKIGSIVEIATQKGLAYAQYTHKHNQYGALLRVYSGFHETRPNHIALSSILESAPIFLCFFPLSAAVNRGIVSIVDNTSLPLKSLEFPIFRAGVVDPSTGKVATWWLWDGEKEWRVGELTNDQRKLPIRGVWNDTLLIERIESEWTPDTDAT